MGQRKRTLFEEKKLSFNSQTKLYCFIPASLRNIGNRIARIFTRKKDRHLEGSKETNERNQKTSADSKPVLATPNQATANDARHVTSLSQDAPVTEEHFEKCTSYSVKSKQDSASTHSVNTLGKDSERNSDFDKTQVHMENKPKDINQWYREMEEVVAKQVRETMELADTRRRELAEGTLRTTQKQITNVDNTDGVTEPSHDVTEHISEPNDNEDVTQKVTTDDDYLEKEEIRQEFEDINKSIEEEQAKIYRATETRRDVKDVEPTASKPQCPLQSGFEDFAASANAEKDNLYNTAYSVQLDVETGIPNLAQNNKDKDYLLNETDQTRRDNPLDNHHETKPQTSFEQTQDNLPNQRPDDFQEVKQGFAQDTLNTEQKVWNIEEVFEGIVFDDGTETDSLILTQTTVGTNPFETVADTNAELRWLGDKALTLAQNSITNYSTNPFETSDDEVEIRLTESNMSTMQDIWKDQLKNNLDTIDDDEMEIKEIREEVLFIAQDAPQSYAKNPFGVIDEDVEGELRFLGADALNIAQTGARNVEAAKEQLGENVEDLDNAFNSLIDSTDLPDSVVEIGFDRLEQAVKEQRGETDRDREIGFASNVIQSSK